MELKKIRILSLAKLTTLFGLIGGIVMSIILAVVKKIASSQLTEEILLQTPALQMIATFSLTSALYLILQYTVIGFVWGIVVAVVYNILARYIGGVHLEFSEKGEKSLNILARRDPNLFLVSSYSI